MSWSFTKESTPAKAREEFLAAHQAQPAYQNDGAHKVVMDKIAAFAADIAEAAPGDSTISLGSNGHVNTDGYGSCQVQLSFFKPWVAPTA